MELNPIPPVHMRPPVPDPLPPPCGRHTWMAPYLYLSRPPISFSEVLQPLFSLCCRPTSSLERTPKFKTYQFAHPPNPPLISTACPLLCYIHTSVIISDCNHSSTQLRH